MNRRSFFALPVLAAIPAIARCAPSVADAGKGGNLLLTANEARDMLDLPPVKYRKVWYGPDLDTGETRFMTRAEVLRFNARAAA